MEKFCYSIKEFLLLKFCFVPSSTNTDNHSIFRSTLPSLLRRHNINLTHFFSPRSIEIILLPQIYYVSFMLLDPRRSLLSVIASRRRQLPTKLESTRISQCNHSIMIQVLFLYSSVVNSACII